MKYTRLTLGTILIVLVTLFTGTAAWAAPAPQAAAPAAPAAAPATVTYTDPASWSAAAGYPTAINLQSLPVGISTSSGAAYGSNGQIQFEEGGNLYLLEEQFTSPIYAFGAYFSSFNGFTNPLVVSLNDGEVLTGSVNGSSPTFFGFVSTSPISSVAMGEEVPYWATDYLRVQDVEIVLPPITVAPTITTGPVNFGQVNVGSNNTQTVVLSINRPLTLATLQTSGDYSVESDSCALNTPLANGTLCTLQVQFAPASPGPRWFPLLVTDSNSNPYSFGFEGTGVGSALAFTPGIITTVAGNGSVGYNGDNIAAPSAELDTPYIVAVDSAGNLYIADAANSRIRKVDASGNITTVAGNGTAGYNGDSIPATSAELSYPVGVAVDSAGDLYIADENNHRIRKVDASGNITTVAGNGTAGYNGDSIPATSAELFHPFGVAVDSAGTLYIADTYNHRIRKVDVSGNITTVAGNGGIALTGGDYITATNSALYYPVGLAVDSAGNFYIADGGARIRKVDTSGVITTVAGNGTLGYNGDDIVATSAELESVSGVALDSAGNLYIADQYNYRVRKVDLSGTITTVAGTGVGGYNGDNLAATSVELNAPRGVAVDSAGDLYIADNFNQRIRKVDVTNSALSFGTLKLGQTGGAQRVATSDVGDAPLNFNSFFASSNFLLQDVGNDCVTGTPLAVGATCALGVAFAPTMSGNPLTGELNVSDNAFNTPQSVSLSGISSIPEASLSAPSLSFGNQQVGAPSLAQTVTVTSTGSANLTISTVIMGGTNASDFLDSDTCTGATVTPNNTCTVSVTFTPGAVGARSSSMTINDNASKSPQIVSLSGTGEYGVCALYDQTKSVKSGATIPIKLTLCSASGGDVSSSAVIVHAVSLTVVSGYSGAPEASGNANPDSDFRYDSTLGPTGGYIFNLSTKGLATGTYCLQFTAGSDPVKHSVNFGVN